MQSGPAKKMLKRTFLPALLATTLLLLSADAQDTGFRRTRFGRSYGINSPEAIREQEEMTKALVPGFEDDTFTFARLVFDTDARYGLGGPRPWDDDSPEADLNLTYRLFQVTSVKIHPGLNNVDIKPQDLEKYPFAYMAAAGRIVLTDSDAETLRRYMLNGGFIMAEDFWGDEQWAHFRDQMKRVFPEFEPVELSLDHPIFHSVYHFRKAPQMPSVRTFFNYGTAYEPGWPYYSKSHEPHYYGIFDSKNRMMMIICHNNHYGDGWEHESDEQSYFETFSEPMAYPMFINILQYTMTH